MRPGPLTVACVPYVTGHRSRLLRDVRRKNKMRGAPNAQFDFQLGLKAKGMWVHNERKTQQFVP